jgi:hypothetical protein
MSKHPPCSLITLSTLNIFVTAPAIDDMTATTQ